MTQIYKVFIETKPLIIHNIPMYLSDNENYIYIKVDSHDDCTNIIDLFWSSPSLEGVSLYCVDVESFMSRFKASFKLVKAAGGIVNNNNNKKLVIKRNGFLDLPKGHFKKGESPEQAALREVQEECGIVSHSITDSTPKYTYHMYKENGESIFKETLWFKMSTPNGEKLIPQIEEGIEDVFWMTENEIKEDINQFYPSLLELLGE